MRCLCNAHLPSLSPSFSSSSSPPAFLRHGAATTSRRTALAARPASMQHCSTSPRRTHVACRALLDGAGMLDTLITWGAVGASATAVAYALFYTWPCASGGGSHLPGTRTTVSVSSSLQVPEDNFTWAIMGGLSCIPLFNSMAWVLGALQSDAPRAFYWAAALYALPLLHNGFDQDAFSITLLLLGALHMQVLRIGATEPELQSRLQQQLKPLAVVRALAGAAATATRTATGVGTRQQQQQQQQQLWEGGQRQTAASLARGEETAAPGSRMPDDDEAAWRAQELQEFDRRLQQLSEARKRQPQRDEPRS